MVYLAAHINQRTELDATRSSNYAMQCATAPTRQECDRAHARGDWLDVGILSIRNLFRIGWQHEVIWALIALSSVPIHLLYNSAIFKTTEDDDYSVVAGPRFLRKDSNSTQMDELARPLHDAYIAEPSPFARLTPEECIQMYASNAGRQGDEDTWGFGQAVPGFLLVLPLSAIFQPVSDAILSIIHTYSTEPTGKLLTYV